MNHWYVYRTNRKKTSRNLVATLSFAIDRECRVSYLCSIRVDDVYRQRGIGSLLVYELAKFLKNQRVWKIEVDNMIGDASLFYERLGFRYVDMAHGAPCGPEMTSETNRVLREFSHLGSRWRAGGTNIFLDKVTKQGLMIEK